MAATGVSLLGYLEISATSRGDASQWRSLAWMVLGGMALRLVITSLVFPTVADPTGGHENFGWEMGWTARSLALGRGFSSPFIPSTGPTALVPPVYPLLLAGIFKIFGLYSKAAAFAALATNDLISALTCIPVYMSTRNALGARSARWAGWAWAVHPFAIYFSSGIVWDFALSSFLFATCFWSLQRLDESGPLRAWGWSGLLCGFAALSNPSILAVLVLLLARAAWRVALRHQPWRARALTAFLALAAVLTPWTARNYRVLHILCPVRDGFWLESFAGNAGDSSRSNPAWAHPASNPAEMRSFLAMGEVAYMAQKKALTLGFIATHPGWFAAVSVRRAVRFWTGFWSFSAGYLKQQPLDLPNFFFCTSLSVAMLVGAVRWMRSGPKTYAPYLIAILVFPLPYYVTHASMDYRQPIETVILTLAVAGFALRPARRPMLEALSEE